MSIKVISRGSKKNGQNTAQVVVNGKTKHLVQQYSGGVYLDSKGVTYDI